MEGGRCGMTVPAQKPAQHRAGGLIRLSNDIGLSVSDNPLSKIFLDFFGLLQLTLQPGRTLPCERICGLSVKR
jgi:hypothetical protein